MQCTTLYGKTLNILKTINCFVLWHSFILEVASHKQDSEVGEVNIGKLSCELVGAEGRAVTYSRGDAATELVVAEVNNSKGWRADAESGRSPLRWLKLISRTTMLPEDISSAGRPPESELYDKLRRDKLVSSRSDGEIFPSRPLEAREISMTTPSSLQVMPSHAQQFTTFCHDMAMPLSCDSPARNRRRVLFSCSTHAMVETAMGSSNSSSNNEEAARPEKGITSLLLHAEWGAIFMVSLITAVFGVEFGC
uniref:Uncharacterized protein n=1 Tax=Oryza punctata TaxID=4537 RepID=A0A0E0JVP6_ORYPU